MKRLYIFLLLIFFASCDSISKYDNPSYNIDLPVWIKAAIDNYMEKGEIRKLCILIDDFVMFETVYTVDILQFRQIDYWQTPEEIHKTGKGDCEDRAILWSWILYQYCGFKPYLINIYNRWDISYAHIYAVFNGYRFNYVDNKYNASDKFDFWTAMKISEYTKTPYK